MFLAHAHVRDVGRRSPWSLRGVLPGFIARADQLDHRVDAFLTIAAAFAEAERDRIRERVSQTKADQKARGRFLGGTVPFGFRRGDNGELIPHEAEQEAIREMVVLRAGAA